VPKGLSGTFRVTLAYNTDPFPVKLTETELKLP
jgi:hypothetical protein